MKGRYNGCHMTIYGTILPGAMRVANWAVRTNISEKTKQRLRAYDNNISLTARYF